MGIGKGGSPTTVTNSQNQNVANVPTGIAGLQQIYNQAYQAAQTPYQPYTGELVAQQNWQQNQGIGNINAAGNPGGADFQKFFNPYQSQVIDALTNNINETNAQQNQQIRGNAIAQHALGGDREAVAEAELARQQNLGNAPAIANALAGGYNTAFNNALQAGEAQFNVGTANQQTQQAYDTAQYQQYLQRLAYPYQQAQFLGTVGIPALGGMGGQQFQTGNTNQITTPPGLSFPQLAAGVGLIGGGLFSNAARGGRMRHRAVGGTDDSNNPYATEPWNVKAVDLTGGKIGDSIKLQDSMPHPLPQVQIQQSPQSNNSLTGNLGSDIAAAKGLGSLAKWGSGLFSGSGAIPVADAASLGGIGSDAAAMAGAGATDAALAAEAGIAADAGAGVGLADLFPLALMALKRGGAAYPKLAVGGSPYDDAVQSLANQEQQGGEELAAAISRGRDLNPYANTAGMKRPAPVSGFAGGGTEDDDDDTPSQPWALENRWVAPAPPNNPAAVEALRNYGLKQAPEVSPSTAYPVPLPQSRPSPYTKPDDADLPEGSTPDSGPTKVSVQKRPGFDPAAATYQDIMDRNNFRDYAPQRQSLISLIKDPKTRGDALMEMGLRILAAPPTSKSGLSEIATGALGTLQSYNQFSKDATTAQEKAQELAAKLKQQSNTSDYQDDVLALRKRETAAYEESQKGLAQQRFQKLLHGNLVPGNYQYPGPTGAVVGAYFDKSTGQYYNAQTHEPLSGGRWAGTNATDLGINRPPGATGDANDPIAAARAAVRAGASPAAVKQRLIENGITPPADL